MANSVPKTADGRTNTSGSGRTRVCAVGASGKLGRYVVRHARFADTNDQVEACRDVGDPVLESNITRRVDFALFMVDALTNDELIREAPAIVGCRTSSALAHANAEG